jgi:hypothetical protein
VVPLDEAGRSCGASPRPAGALRRGLSFVVQAPARPACLVRVDLLRTGSDPAAPIAVVVLRAPA